MTLEEFEQLVKIMERGHLRYYSLFPNIQKVLKRKPKPNIDKEWNEFKKMLDWR